MRALFLIVAVCTAAAQISAAPPTIVVVDENGVAIPSARVSLQGLQLSSKCETDHSGRCHFSSLPPGEYHLRVEKEGFYALDRPELQLEPGATIEVSISHEQEVHEVVDVHESPAAIDPAQITS